jgi:hypothetical protein
MQMRVLQQDIDVVDPDGTVRNGCEIGFEPLIEGRFLRLGYIAADGTRRIGALGAAQGQVQGVMFCKDERDRGDMML